MKVDLPLSNHMIYNLRRRLGIFARIDQDAWWRERMDDLLSLSPSEFAKRHGVSATTASYSRRKYLGEIRTRELGTPPAPPFPWTPELDALLGTDSDLAIARKTGISPQVVRYRRKKLRIPSKPSRRFAMWTPELDALLGTDNDKAIADRLGLGVGQVRYRRLNLGIKPYVRHRRLKDGYHLFADNHLLEKINRLEPHLIKRYRGLGVPIKTLKAIEIIEAAIDYMLERAEKGELREKP